MNIEVFLFSRTMIFKHINQFSTTPFTIYTLYTLALALTICILNSVLQAVAGPVLRRFKVGLLHEVHEDFGRAIRALYDEIDLHEHFAGALEVTLLEVLEALVKDVV